MMISETQHLGGDLRTEVHVRSHLITQCDVLEAPQWAHMGPVVFQGVEPEHMVRH